MSTVDRVAAQDRLCPANKLPPLCWWQRGLVLAALLIAMAFLLAAFR